MPTKDFDPRQRLVGEADGLEYASLADLIRGEPVNCARNEVIASLREHSHVQAGLWTWKEAVFNQYDCQDRNGDLYAARSNPNDRRHLPQGIEFFEPRDPGSSAGDGGPRPLQAPADPVHAAD